MKKIKVLIADDMKILRQGLKAILSQDEEIVVVGTAENGKEAFELCKTLMPDVVLMDMRMPEYDGAFGINAIKEKNPEIKVLVLTTFDDDETISKAMDSGADGYILKEMEDEKIISSVKNVYEGISVFGQSVLNSMRKKMSSNTNATKDIKGLDVDLTARELDVIKLVSMGYDNKEIADELCLAEGTVRNQVSHLLEKIGLKDRTQLAVYAVKHGLDDM